MRWLLIGLPLVEPIEGVVVGAEVVRQPALASKGAVEHPKEGDTIDRSRMDAKPNDPARVLIHDDQDPVGPQRGRLAPEQMRSHEDRFGDRCRERFTIRSWCLRRSDSATTERTPPGPSKRARTAMKWMKRTVRLRIAEC